MIIGLIGDYDETITAHQAIPPSIDLAANALSASVQLEWISSDDIPQQDLNRLAGIWCVPASPYRDMDSVLHAIEFARNADLPFLGTCGGYQHAALEFARNALGYSDADNGEVHPDAAMPLVSALACQLVEVAGEIRLSPGSRIADIYGKLSISEEYPLRLRR